jgi:putative ABC transport system ATP-binding protein
VTRPLRPISSPARAPVDPMIVLQGITKEFWRGAQTVRALADVSLTVRPNEFVAIVGASGSGKSTLLQILGCLELPTRGTYVFEGQPVAGRDDDALSRLRNQRIGFVFQSFNLVPRTTALENVALPLLYADRPPPTAAAASLLERVGLGHRAGHYPTELSGGEQQRVAIARALVMQPALLLADEPTGNLDQTTGEDILALLGALRHDGLTLVLVTHDPRVAARAERVVRLADGRVVT